MGKLAKVALYAAKELAKEQERRRKAEEKEHERLEKESELAAERAKQRRLYEKWLQQENLWREVFNGNQLQPLDWDRELEPRPFIEPERPQTGPIVGEAILKVRERYRDILVLLFLLTVVFLFQFTENTSGVDALFYGIGSLIFGTGFSLVYWYKRRQMDQAEVEALERKQAMEEEYTRTREAAVKNYQQQENERRAAIDAVLEGTPEAVEKTAALYLAAVAWPSGVSCKIKWLAESVMELKIIVPGFEVLNQESAQWDEVKGVVKFNPKLGKETLRQYERFMAAVILRAAWEIFRVCPSVAEIYTGVYTNKTHRTKGLSYEACIMSCVLDRGQFGEIDFRNVEYIHGLENFKLRYSGRGQEFPGDVSPHRYHESADSDHLLELLQMDLDSLSGTQFEDLIAILLEKMGFKAEKTKASHDGGIDIWAYSDHAFTGGRYIIQCKRWANTIPVEVVRDLYGVVTRDKADVGILIATSDLSNDCYKFVEEGIHKIPIKLIGGAQLRSLLAEYEIAN